MNVKSTTVADIVNQNPQAATVFKKYKIDFCCKGKRPLAEACAKAGIDPEILLTEVGQLTREPGSFLRIHAWPTGMICDYIVNNHHQYLRKVIPEINAICKKVAGVHGQNHPELPQIEKSFHTLSKELLLHMNKEEQELFPAIQNKQIDDRLKAEIEAEHEEAGNLMAAINELSNNYQPPADACTSYRVLFELLKEFEDDLHQHVHIENNILLTKV